MKPKQNAFRRLALSTALVVVASQSLQADSYTWTKDSAATQDWTDTLNWSGGSVASGPGTNTDILTVFSDTSTALADGNNLITTNVPTLLALNTLTLNGKGAGATGASNVTIGTSAATWTLGGTSPTVNLNGVNGTQALNHTVASNLTLGAGTTFTGTGTASFNFIGDISGSGITKSGTSTLTLSGNNSLSGAISFVGSAANNILVLKNSSAAGTASFNLYGGVGAIKLDNAGTASNILFSNVISLMSGASASAPIIVNVAGDNKITSTLGINTGGSHTAVQVDGGTLEISGNWGNSTTGRNVYLQGAGNGLYSGKLQFGANNLNKAGAGTWTLSGTNTYTGSTTISGGTLKIASTGSITHTGAAISLNSGTARMDIASGGSVSFSVMSSVNSSQVNIAGNWTGNAAQTSQHNTLAGTYTQTSGTGSVLGLITGNAAGDVTSFYLGGTSTLGVGKGQYTSLQVGGRGSANFAVSGSAALTVSGDANPAANNNNQLVVGNTSTFGSPTTGTRRLIQQGGTVTANGLQLGGGTATATDGIYYLNGGMLTTSTLTRGSNAASTGTLYFGGGTFKSGTAFSTDANIVTTVNSGGATIDTTGGNLVWSGAITAGNTGTVTGISGLAGGSGYTPGQMALTFSPPVSGTTATGYAVVNQSGTVTDIIITNPGSGYTSAPTISGFTGGTGASATAEITTTAGGLTKTGTGTLTLAGTNTYTGNTTVSAGTLVLDATGSLKFAPPASGSSNKITGGGSAALNGSFALELAGAGAVSRTWTLVDAAHTGSLVSITSDLPVSFVGSAGIWTAVDGSNTWTYTESSGVLDLSVAAASGYASWLALHPGILDPAAGADPENDGIENVLEYVLNGDPTVSDPSILPDLDASGANYVFTFTRRVDSADDTTQVFQYGSDLTGWTDVAITGTPGSEVALGTPSGGLQLVTVTISKSLAGPGGSLFGRLQVTQP